MPSYDYLFSDDRGEALVDYLLSLHADEPRWSGIQNWSLAPNYDSVALTHGGDLFQHHCAICHEQIPRGSETLATQLRKVPPNLANGPFIFAPPALPEPVRRAVLARIIKFGIPGTDMPGHEYLPDRDVFALTQYVEQCSQQR